MDRYVYSFMDEAKNSTKIDNLKACSLGSVDYINIGDKDEKMARNHSEPISYKLIRQDLNTNKLVIIYNADELEMAKEHCKKKGYEFYIVPYGHCKVMFRKDKKQLHKCELKGGYEDIWLSIQQMI